MKRKDKTMSENTNTEETQRLTRKLDPLVRPLLSERIKYRLSLCTRCDGTGVYVDDEIKFSCMDCCDWLNALKDVERLEECLRSARTALAEVFDECPIALKSRHWMR